MKLIFLLFMIFNTTIFSQNIRYVESCKIISKKIDSNNEMNINCRSNETNKIFNFTDKNSSILQNIDVGLNYKVYFSGTGFQNLKLIKYSLIDIKGLERIIKIISNVKTNKSFILDKNDKNIFQNYPYYPDSKTYSNQTAKLLLKLVENLDALNYKSGISESFYINNYEYHCSVEIFEKPISLVYVDGNIFGYVSCSSEFDSMGYFEKFYLKKINNYFYILDYFTS